MTGANGFVGRHVCEAFLAAGWHVAGGVRRPEAEATLPAGVCPVTLDFDAATDDDLEASVEGIDVVVHLVARTHILNDRAANPLEVYRQANVATTRRLARACLARGVSRLVYMSSIQVVGDGGPSPYTETTTCEPQHPYGISKLEAERALCEEVRGTKLETVILRPPLVYGPHVLANFLRLMKLARLGVPLPLSSIRNQRSLVFVKNLADAVCVAAVHASAAGEVFHVADTLPLSTGEMVARLARLQGARSMQFPVPTGLLRWAGRLLNRQGEVARFTGSLTVSTDKIRQSLNWTPPYDTNEGLRQTVAWFEVERATAAQHDPGPDSASEHAPARAA